MRDEASVVMTRGLEQISHEVVEAIAYLVCGKRGQWMEGYPSSGLVDILLQRETQERTVVVFVCMLGKECVKSHQGEISTPPAGKGKSASRINCKSASDMPPPAESPAMTTWAGSMGR